MSVDLASQLERYYAQVDGSDSPIDPSEVASRFDVVRPLPITDTKRIRRPALIAATAAAAALILLGGAAWLSQRDAVSSADELVETTVAEPTQTTIPQPTESTIPEPPTTAALDTQGFPVWTRVQGPQLAPVQGGSAELTTDSSGFLYCGDGFIATSPDGIDWQRRDLGQRTSCLAWDGIVVHTDAGGRDGGEGSGDPVVVTGSVVEVSQPDGSWSQFHIDGGITSAAIGGTGILISTVDNRLDPALGLDLTPEEDGSVVGTTDDAGILTVHFADGTTRTVDLVAAGFDEHAENIYRTRWWFTENGVDWTEQASSANLERRPLGTQTGFYATDDSAAWFTTTGDSWTRIGAVPEDGFLVRSGDRAVYASTEGSYVLSPDGLQEIPAQGLPANSYPLTAGEPGVLAAQFGSGEELETKLHYARRGQPFGLEDLPPEMEAANTWGFHMPTAAAVGNRYLVLLFEEDWVPAFWIRDFPTD